MNERAVEVHVTGPDGWLAEHAWLLLQDAMCQLFVELGAAGYTVRTALHPQQDYTCPFPAMSYLVHRPCCGPTPDSERPAVDIKMFPSSWEVGFALHAGGSRLARPARWTRVPFEALEPDTVREWVRELLAEQGEDLD